MIQTIDKALGTQGMRIILVALFLSMHPFGRQFLASFGFEFRDQKLLEETVAATHGNRATLDNLTKAMSDLHEDAVKIKEENLKINSKVDRLELAVAALQKAYEKHQALHEQKP